MEIDSVALVCMLQKLHTHLATCLLVVGLCLTGRPLKAETRADAALQIADDLAIPHSADKSTLHGLYPAVFPGGYNGRQDISQFEKTATMENVIVALVRWAGWDTVHYDENLANEVKKYVSPEGFPYYGPDPTPRSIPYIVVALKNGVLTPAMLPELLKPVSRKQVDDLCKMAKRASLTRNIVPALVLNNAGLQHLDQAKNKPDQLLILPTGFQRYDQLHNLPNRILDLNAPSIRLFNASSALATGKQDYFPLGPLESQLSVGLRVDQNSYSHQAESIYGEIENESSTVNAVGMWGSASSMRRDARVWGGFLLARSAEGPKSDAQIIGLEVDAINNALPGVNPNRSKTGVQIVGIGTQPLTNALEIIGAGRAQWANGILFSNGSIYPSGAVIGLSDTRELDRGIDFSQTRFRNSAFLLKQGSSISFANKSGNASLIYTDAFNSGHLVLKAGTSGLRITSNNDSKNLAIIDATGNIITPRGNFDSVLDDVKALKSKTINVSAVPKHSTDSCQQGSWAADSRFVYVCVLNNTWRRAELSSW